MKQQKASLRTDSFPRLGSLPPEVHGGHEHYCSSCRAYWDHEDGKCANRGYAMSCPVCLQAFCGVSMR